MSIHTVTGRQNLHGILGATDSSVWLTVPQVKYEYLTSRDLDVETAAVQRDTHYSTLHYNTTEPAYQSQISEVHPHHHHSQHEVH